MLTSEQYAILKEMAPEYGFEIKKLSEIDFTKEKVLSINNVELINYFNIINLRFAYWNSKIDRFDTYKTNGLDEVAA